jgi:hypothetical protein
MKFSFSRKFPQSNYAILLQELAGQVERFRILSGCNVTRMMTDLHIGHPTLKKS